MIAKLSAPFADSEDMDRKIEYQERKIDLGTAQLLFSNNGEVSLENLLDDMLLVSSLNDNVKKRFVEISINLAIGEVLNNDTFLTLTQEYLQEMGYGDSCYAVILNTDKEHLHVHVLATTIDRSGKWIDDSKSKLRSQRISRELEVRYGLKETLYHQFDSKSLGEIKAREYYFHNALQKAFRSKISNQLVTGLIEDNKTALVLDLTKVRTNEEYKTIFGENLYNRIGRVLENNNHFNSLYKDELLSVMDSCYSNSKDVFEFKKRLEDNGYYMRLVTDKGKSNYVYAIPNVGAYFQDKSFPQRYRYGNVSFDKTNMSRDEQKHYIYNTAFIALSTSRNYDEFKEKMNACDVNIIEHTSSKGVYGLSFHVLIGEEQEVFKSSEVSRRLTYSNMQNLFDGEKSLIDTVVRNPAIIKEMKADIEQFVPEELGYSTTRQRDEEEPIKKKKKKKKNRGI